MSSYDHHGMFGGRPGINRRVAGLGQPLQFVAGKLNQPDLLSVEVEGHFGKLDELAVQDGAVTETQFLCLRRRVGGHFCEGDSGDPCPFHPQHGLGGSGESKGEFPLPQRDDMAPHVVAVGKRDRSYQAPIRCVSDARARIRLWRPMILRRIRLFRSGASGADHENGQRHQEQDCWASHQRSLPPERILLITTE